MFKRFFKQLFCSHNFQDFDRLDCTIRYEDNKVDRCPITLLICSKCGKRKVIRDRDWYYNTELLEKVKLWEKGLYNFQNYTEHKTIPLRRIK